MSGRLIISHHKSWHVWNKDNLERVAKDEAEHAARVEEDEKKAKLADGEARLALLRKRASSLRGEVEEPSQGGVVPVVAVQEEEKKTHFNIFSNEDMFEQMMSGPSESKRSKLNVQQHKEEGEGEGTKRKGKTTKQQQQQQQEEELFSNVVRHKAWYERRVEDRVDHDDVIEKRKLREERWKLDEDPMARITVALEVNKQYQDMRERGIAIETLYREMKSGNNANVNNYTSSSKQAEQQQQKEQDMKKHKKKHKKKDKKKKKKK